MPWKQALLWLISACLCAEAAPLNVVWIIADDLSPDLGAYGAAGVATPHLDRLAAEGRRYTRAYATAPVCSASRSAFILGCSQTTTGLHAHDVENPQPLPAPYLHLPELLRAAGWFVTNAPAPGSAKKKAKTHYNFAHDPQRMFDGDDWRRRRPGQPFFAQFQISEPHRPFPIPAAYAAERLRELKLPANYPDHPLVRRDWYAYLRSVETVDARVGAILEQLRAAGELERTLVMFFADHGRPMPWGKQWLTVEGLQVPLIIRGPGVRAGVEAGLVSLIDLAPSVLERAGLAVPDWMQGRPLLGDRFPQREAIFAARDRCGDAADRIRAVITPGHLLVRHFDAERPWLNWSSYKEAGYPAMPLLRELQRAGRLTPLQAACFAPRPPVQLFELDRDPLGLADRSGDPASAALRRSLELQLADWMARSGDRGALPDAATEPPLAQIQRDKRADYRRTWQRRGLEAEPTDAARLRWWLQQYGLQAAPALPPR